jgi:hypothetical protein
LLFQKIQAILIEKLPLKINEFTVDWSSADGHELPVATGSFMAMNMAE